MSTRIIGRRVRRAITAAAIAVVLAPTITSAHTDTDLVAVPAGTEATVTFRPQHGCGDSPTIAVSVRAPVSGAVAEEVDGWTATSTPDDAGRTILEWTGGTLPVDEAGAFPIEFLVPDTVGELLTFPAVQVCENGEELAWISGDPADEYPAPRLLILAAGSEPAATIDDVPLDAPGRDQLTAIVDVDNPEAATTVPVTAAPAPTEPVATEPVAIEPVATEPVATDVAPTDADDTTLGLGTAAEPTDDDGSTSTVWIVIGIIAFVAVAAGAILVARRRGSGSTPEG